VFDYKKQRGASAYVKYLQRNIPTDYSAFSTFIFAVQYHISPDLWHIRDYWRRDKLFRHLEHDFAAGAFGLHSVAGVPETLEVFIFSF